MRTHSTASMDHQRLFIGATLWLLAGSFLLLTTLLPAHTELFGWTPLFWLFGAPLSVLLVLEPGFLRRRVKPRRAQQLSTVHGALWR